MARQFFIAPVPAYCWLGQKYFQALISSSQQMKGMQSSQHNIQTSVSNIQTRIDTIDQVLHALLFVASEQLSTSAAPHTPNRSRINAAGLGSIRRPQNQYLLEANPTNIQTVPGLLSGANSRAIRSTGHPSEAQNVQQNRLESSPGVEIRRTTDLDENSYSSLSYGTAVPRPDRRKHEDVDIKHKGKHAHSGSPHHSDALLSQLPNPAPNYPSPKPQRKASVDSVEAGKNPINELLRKQAESSEAQDIPIEHWITAAMHWYFKASYKFPMVIACESTYTSPKSPDLLNMSCNWTNGF